ncbi:MAG: undecaprenyl-diphosphate phosphatase [Bacillota bacterium]|nr:undecaprenyl-diphosphate phosphatase [Bacillota bacterium]
MNYLKYCILGLIQGLTEFLPVSSSGHLAIFKKLLGDATFGSLGLTYDILLHLATLIAVFVVFYKDVWELICGFFGLIRDIFKGQLDLKKNIYQRFVVMIIVASVPAALVGFALGDVIEEAFTKYLILVGITLLLTGILLLVSDRIVVGNVDIENIKFKNALIPGLFQAAAIVPGLSRSGSTITGALFAGCKREFAVKFSFLMSIPVVLGSALVDIMHLASGEGSALLVGPSIAGMIVAAIVGFLSIKFMLKLIAKSKLHYFAYYCFGVGLFVIIWQIFR